MPRVISKPRLASLRSPNQIAWPGLTCSCPPLVSVGCRSPPPPATAAPLPAAAPSQYPTGFGFSPNMAPGCTRAASTQEKKRRQQPIGSGGVDPADGGRRGSTLERREHTDKQVRPGSNPGQRTRTRVQPGSGSQIPGEPRFLGQPFFWLSPRHGDGARDLATLFANALCELGVEGGGGLLAGH